MLGRMVAVETSCIGHFNQIDSIGVKLSQGLLQPFQVVKNAKCDIAHYVLLSVSQCLNFFVLVCLRARVPTALSRNAPGVGKNILGKLLDLISQLAPLARRTVEKANH